MPDGRISVRAAHYGLWKPWCSRSQSLPQVSPPQAAKGLILRMQSKILFITEVAQWLLEACQDGFLEGIFFV
jgi:hypothetical protein